MIADLITHKAVIGVAIVLAAGILLRIGVRLAKKRAKRKELRQLAEDRQREEALDSVLVNPHGDGSPAVSESIPYEVDYAQGSRRTNAQGAAGQIMVQLTEHNELSRRRHMMSLEKNIRIGSSVEGNSIVVAGVSPCQCELFQYRGNVCIRDVGQQQMTVLQRKRQKVYVGQKSIQVQTGDKIILGDIEIDVMILK